MLSHKFSNQMRTCQNERFSGVINWYKVYNRPIWKSLLLYKHTLKPSTQLLNHYLIGILPPLKMTFSNVSGALHTCYTHTQYKRMNFITVEINELSFMTLGQFGRLIDLLMSTFNVLTDATTIPKKISTFDNRNLFDLNLKFFRTIQTLDSVGSVLDLPFMIRKSISFGFSAQTKGHCV